MRKVALAALLLAACASAPSKQAEVAVTETGVPTLAPPDEPGLLLFGFENDAELHAVKAVGTALALGTEGATEGKQALKLTLTREVPGGSDGVRLLFAPPSSWAGMHELAIDVTNPNDHPLHLVVTLVDASDHDRDHRRKAHRTLAPHTRGTLRVLLSGEWGPALPLQRRSGLPTKVNDVEIDLEHVHAVYMLAENPVVGDSVIIDRVRLVKRDAQNNPISPEPPIHKPKLAVIDVADLTGGLGAKAKLITSLLYDEAAAPKTADVIGAQDVADMLSLEKQKELLGCTDSSCLSDIAGALGTDFMLTGQVGQLGSRYRLDVRLIDAKHSKVVATHGDFASGDDALADTATRLVREVLADGGLSPKK